MTRAELLERLKELDEIATKGPWYVQKHLLYARLGGALARKMRG